MDDAAARSYVAAVNLLLLLSALLSALTGGQAGVRVPQAAVAISRVSAPASVASAARVAVAGRPAIALPTLTDTQKSFGVAWRLGTTVPLFAGRRRE